MFQILSKLYRDEDSELREKFRENKICNIINLVYTKGKRLKGEWKSNLVPKTNTRLK